MSTFKVGDRVIYCGGGILLDGQTGCVTRITDNNRVVTVDFGGKRGTYMVSASNIRKIPEVGCELESYRGEDSVNVPEPQGVKSDVTHPNHYMLFDNVEAIEVIARSMTVEQFKGYVLGNILKYRLRAGKKSELATMEKDLKKAAFYQELFDKYKGLCHA